MESGHSFTAPVTVSIVRLTLKTPTTTTEVSTKIVCTRDLLTAYIKSHLFTALNQEVLPPTGTSLKPHLVCVRLFIFILRESLSFSCTWDTATMTRVWAQGPPHLV